MPHMTDYYIEYGGGLGDIFFQIYFEGAYRALDELTEADRAVIGLITHNPHTGEIFANHPRTGQLTVRNLGYWLPSQDQVMRAKHRLPNRSIFPITGRPVRFYPTEADRAALPDLQPQRVIVFAPGAGLADRNLSPQLVSNLAAVARESGFLPVFVGRSYERHGRAEYYPVAGEGVSLVDVLSVPGVAALVESADGIVACHSAISMLGWCMRKPQLLLYPQSVYERHIAARDQWTFGIDFPECRHARFDDSHLVALAYKFFSDVKGARMDGLPVPSVRARRKTVRLPAESQSIELDETIARLTSAQETKFLCWLAQRAEGNIVEIGCNKGLTTRDLARSNPSKIVYGVDYFVRRAGHDWQIGERPSAEDLCIYARQLRNVVVLHADSASLNYEALVDVGIVFIDGDHTLEGVRADTECALRFLKKRGGGIIVWHDYYETAPYWVGVRPYVDSLDLDIVRVEGTWIALAQLGESDVSAVLAEIQIDAARREAVGVANAGGAYDSLGTST
jgi:hypothetical protein